MVNRRENLRHHTGQLLEALMRAVAWLGITKTPCSANLVRQDITSVPVILHDNLQSESHKLYGPPSSVT